MNFEYSERVRELQARVNDFMDRYVIPANRNWLELVHGGERPIALLENLRALARDEGLWNMFLPGLSKDEPGTGLSNLEYAPLAEIMGRLIWAPEVFNCNAPDTGNMELLHMFASADQYGQWLLPLLRGEIRSCFAMTEPDVASSDATNICTRIARDGDDYVINGRKWFITGAADPRCRLVIVMGVTNPDAEQHRQQSMILVPMDAPGVEVIRDISIINHHSPEGHCEMVFRNVRVPASYLLSEEGSGFALAQARLGPGRIHHCMRSIGQAELALALMCERAQERKSFGKYLHEQGVVTEWIARSRCEIEQARLLVLKTAWLIDTKGAKAARNEISMIKAIVPQVHTDVLNRAMQVFGAMGLSPDTPLATLWTWGRALHILDGPDEVHLRSIGRNEIRQGRENFGAGSRFLSDPALR